MTFIRNSGQLIIGLLNFYVSINGEYSKILQKPPTTDAIMDTASIKNIFVKKLGQQSGLTRLFEHLPDIYFFAKNRDLQFVMCNQHFAEKCGAQDESEVIGKTDYDFFPADLSKNYNKDDINVISSGQIIINRVELVPNEDGTVDWHSTNKEPLYDTSGSIIGICGTTRNIKRAGSLLHPYLEMSNVIEYISKYFHTQIDVKQLAKMASLSVSQFERKFKNTFQMSPMGFVIKVRIKAACKDLINTRDTISNIALRLGFYDQSHFSKQFTNHMGISPKAYRKQYKHRSM
jgi:PAS domain S-box-containing protein